MIILFLIPPLLIQGQGFWNHVLSDKAYNLSRITDKGIFQDSILLVSGFVRLSSCESHRLFAFDQRGQIRWVEDEGYHDVIYADSDHIYSAGFFSEIDDVGGYQQVRISKYNARGEEVFSIGYPETPHNDYTYIFDPQNMDVGSDGTILVSSTQSVIKTNTTGTELQEFSLDILSQIQSVHFIQPDSYLIHTEDKLYLSDASFELVDSMELTQPILDLNVKNDTLYLLANSSIMRFNTNLERIDTLINSSSEMSRMEWYDEELWVQLESSDRLELIHLRDSGERDTVSFPRFVNDPEFIVNGDQFTIIGNSFSGQIGMYGFLNEEEAEIADLPNIELSDIEIDSIEPNYVNSHLYGYIFSTEVTVRNSGEQPLHSFAVYARLNGGFNCARPFIYRTFSGVNLLPGESTTVSLGRNLHPGTDNTLCFRSLAPNSSLEVVTVDNSHCKTFVITSAENKVQPEFRVYPNPSTDYLTVETAAEKINELELLDLSGRTVLLKSISGQKTRMDIHHLQKGAYVCKLKGEGGTYTQLIMKQ